jgi:CBS domain-containing protein
MMKVGQICTRGVATITPSAPLIEAARVMCDRHVGAVVVVSSSDRSEPVGVLTDRDIVRAQLERVADLSRVQVSEVMTRNPLVMDEDEPIGAVIRQMRARGVRRAPVLSASGILIGIVSSDDLLCHVADEVAALAQLVAQQPRQEATVTYHS